MRTMPGAVAVAAGVLPPVCPSFGVTHFISIAVQYLFTFIYNIRWCFAFTSGHVCVVCVWNIPLYNSESATTHTPTCSWLKYCEKCKIVYGAAAGKQNKQINKQILHLQQQGADRIAHLVRKNARHSVFHAALINKNNSRKVSDKLLDQSPVWKVAKFFERHLKITVQSCQIHGKSTLKYISSIQNFLTRKKNTTLVVVVSLKSL